MLTIEENIDSEIIENAKIFRDNFFLRLFRLYIIKELFNELSYRKSFDKIKKHYEKTMNSNHSTVRIP